MEPEEKFSELDLITTKDLFEELQKRFRAVLLVAESYNPQRDQYVTECYYSGGPNAVIGLAEHAKHKALNDDEQPHDHTKPDDDE